MALVSKNFSDIITFTRASSATFTGSNGLIQSTPQSKNLLLWTEAFDNAAWANNGGTVTANALVAPDGSTTAEYLVRSTAAADGRYQTITAGTSGVVTASVYIKKDTSPQSLIWLYDATAAADRLFATVTWSGSTPVITAATGTAATPQDAGNGWWRIAITSTALTGANTNRLYLLPAYTAASNGQQTAFWGAQLEVGSTATSYTKNDGGLFPPRFDYDPVTLAAKGLLIEEQRTNLLTYSEDFSNAAWNNSASATTVTANTATAPDGTVTADTWTINAAGSRYISQTKTVAATTAHTVSFYVKPLVSNWFYINIVDGVNNAGYTFNVASGTLGQSISTGLTPTPTITPAGNGWYRCSVTTTTSGTSVEGRGQVAASASSVSAAVGDSLYVWGAQLEAGSLATSYIPTVASQVTRAADVASVNTLSPWYNATEGTLFVEGLSSVGTPSANAMITSIGDASANNQISIYRTSGNSLLQLISSGGVTQSNIGSGLVAANSTNYKFATCYKINDFAFCVNSNTVVTDTSGAVPVGPTQLVIGSWTGGGAYWNSHIRRITYYPRRLSNAELQAITA